MILYAKKVLIFVFVLLLQVHDLVSTCSEICHCKNDFVACEGCANNITFLEITRSVVIPVCCNNNINYSILEKYSNITLKEISIVPEKSCNISNLDINVSFVDTYSINVQNNSLKKIKFTINKNNLGVIILSSNKLEYINRGLFNDYINLVRLMLNKNELKTVHEGSFNGLSKLEFLDLSENKLTVLDNVFMPLKNLQHLNLSRNNLEFIHKNYFNNWLLQHLDVSHNNLKNVAPGALQLLPNLARLLLSDNPHLGIRQLDTQLLLGTGRRLQQIDVSRTGLFQVPEAFTHSVRFLSLVGNKISAIRCGDLDSYPLLQSLDFSDNKIVNVEDDSLGRLEMLLFLNINNNLLTVIPKTLPDELKYLSVSNNFIKNLTTSDFKELPNLRILLLQNNQIRFVENHVFDDLLSLEMLDLSNNPIQILTPSTFDGPLSLRDLRLCHLNMSMPKTDGSFPISAPENIQMLHLQSSPGLAKQLLSDSATLAALSHLQYLDLRMNNLSDIRKDLLFYLVQLKTLRLHGNSINCNTELWLREWMNWNKSISHNETCYYTTTENKDDDLKYNCTFSETFTINESLPPVNLYSTEMINKLLRYYGYLNNKTERISYKKDNNKTINISAILKNNTVLLSKEYILNNTITKKHKNVIKTSLLINEPYLTKSKEYTNILDQTGMLNDEINIDHSIINTVSNNMKTKYIEDAITNKVWINIAKNKTGKRLNTPLNVTNKNHIQNLDHNEINQKDIYDLNIKVNASATILIEENGTETNAVHSMTKSKYSPYRAVSSKYAQYFGTVLVSLLILTSLILWASFRLRYRRRGAIVTLNEAEDQIEVSNISGGVLW